jgi:hypothetical protein
LAGSAGAEAVLGVLLVPCAAGAVQATSVAITPADVASAQTWRARM